MCLHYLHGLWDFLSSEGGLDPAGCGVHPSGHPQVVERLILLTNCIFCVDSSNLWSSYDKYGLYHEKSTSWFPFSIAFFSFSFSAFSSLSHFLLHLSRSFAANLRLNKCFSMLAKDIFWSTKQKNSSLCCFRCYLKLREISSCCYLFSSCDCDDSVSVSDSGQPCASQWELEWLCVVKYTHNGL